MKKCAALVVDSDGHHKKIVTVPAPLGTSVRFNLIVRVTWRAAKALPSPTLEYNRPHVKAGQEPGASRYFLMNSTVA